MKNFLQTRLWVILMAMPIMVHAERIPHEHHFPTLVSNSEITVTNSNTTAETDLLTYQCSGGAKFNKDHIYKSQWSFNLLDYGSTVTTTKIDELEEFTIGVITNSDVYDCTNLKVKVSKDGVNWGTQPITSSDSITYTASSIRVTLPRNNYYVRLYNTNGSKDISIISIFWYQDHCNCFIYEAE